MLLLLPVISLCLAVSTAYAQVDRILAQGSPPLTQKTVDKTIAFLEWSLDIRLPEPDKQRIGQVLISQWTANNRGFIGSILHGVDNYEQILRLPEAEQNSIRDQIRTGMLESFRKDPNNEFNGMLLRAYEASQLARVEPSRPLNSRAAASKDTSRLWTFTTSDLLPPQQARSVLQQIRPVIANAASDDRGRLGFEQAIANARKFLNERASREALTAFNSSPHARDANRAGAAAVGAVTFGRPLAALAALLRAHELQPQNATHLAGLAAVLCYLGMPQEALAILESPIVKNGRLAAPLGKGGRAGVLNTQGFALLQLGRAKEAEAVLRQAVAQPNALDEAKTNLAAALWTQDEQTKKDEAGQLIAAVWRRTPSAAPKSTATQKTPPGETDRAGSEDLPSELFAPAETRTAKLDLSRGKRLRIPDLKIPATMEASVAMHPKYSQLQQRNLSIIRALGARQEQLHDIVENRLKKNLDKADSSSDAMATLNSVTAITAQQQRIEAINELIEFENVKQHPSVRPFWEKARQARLNEYQGVDFEQQWLVDGMPAGIADRGSQSRQLAEKFNELKRAEQAEKSGNFGRFEEIEKKYRQMRCAAARDAHARWRLAVHGFDTAHRNFLEAAYKHATAVIANIADPSEHELAQIQIERDIYTAWNEHIIIVDSFYNRANLSLKYDCVEATPQGTSEKIEDLHAEKAENCPDALKGNNKAKIDFEVVEVSFNCEQVGVELSAGVWIGLFAEGTINADGDITVTAGVKADAELVGFPGVGIPADLGAKAGVFVKIGKSSDPAKGWQIKDVGMSGELSASRGAGPIAIESSTGVEYSFLPAVAVPSLPR